MVRTTTMNVFVVHAHPEPQSFVSALKDTAVAELSARGHEVRVSDLYAMGFEPVCDRHDVAQVFDPAYFRPQREQLHAAERGAFAPDIEAELDKLFWCDLVIFTFPLWWFSVPAILKGWVDRVFVMGRVYGYGRSYDTGLLKGRRGMLALSTGGPEGAYQPGARNGAMPALLYPIHHGMLAFVGMEVVPPFVAYGPARMSDEERRAALDAFRARLATIEEAKPLRFELPGF
jgi:NAD(P)H dehydrogenase (quinone)